MKLIEQAIHDLSLEGIAPVMQKGKITYGTNFKPGGPWIYAKYSTHNCVMLMRFLYRLISERLPDDQRFIPSECQNCYKVVARPTRYKDMLLLKGIQKAMKLPGKCGIETRETVDALYGAYWYCIGKDHGKTVLEIVKKKLSGMEMPIFLKRGCTEYEAAFGPSDTWKIVDGQRDIEREFFNTIAVDNTKKPQTQKEKAAIMREWKKFAKELGPDYKGSHDYVTY